MNPDDIVARSDECDSHNESTAICYAFTGTEAALKKQAMSSLVPGHCFGSGPGPYKSLIQWK